METKASAVWEDRGKTLETFLRGMETQCEMWKAKVIAAALKPSLEGWKPIHCPFARSFSATLKPSLEGWKRGDWLESFTQRQALKPSLEGWKP